VRVIRANTWAPLKPPIPKARGQEPRPPVPLRGEVPREISRSLPSSPKPFHCFQLASNSAFAASSVATWFEMRRLSGLLGQNRDQN
jgi:hypothetical protein